MYVFTQDQRLKIENEKAIQWKQPTPNNVETAVKKNEASAIPMVRLILYLKYLRLTCIRHDILHVNYNNMCINKS